MLLSVIVPAFDSAATLGRCLEAIAGQDLGEPFEVIVVDDGSSDGSARIAAEAGGNVQLLEQPNRGPGPARNLGAARARGEILAFTDADCFPAPDWLRSGVEEMEAADLVQGSVRPDPQASRGPLDRTVWVVAETGLYEAANLFVSRELFESLGGFVDFLGARIGKPLAEDVWFGWRARRAGARTRFSDAAVVNHAVFHRGLPGFVGERLRRGYFPLVVVRVPELRRSLLFARVFLDRRTAATDLAVAAAAATAATGSPLPMLAAIPYGWSVSTASLRWRRRAPEALAGGVLADIVGLIALLAGSVRARRLVL
jgi:glycosyltransferase involved in cell wall biosynthesis